MRKILCFAAAIVFGCSTSFAHSVGECSSKSFYVILQGGTSVSYGENMASYKDNSKTGDLFGPQGGLAAGYDFGSVFGLRLAASYGRNAGACNAKETSAGSFYPYDFKSLGFFADAVVDLTGFDGQKGPLSVKLYAGVGLGYSFDFTDSGHPWQSVSDKNTVPGFRGGLMVEYSITEQLGLLLDACAEAYGDSFNGLNPKSAVSSSGNHNFRLDGRESLSFGVCWHFR